MALRLAKFFDVSAGFCLDLQVRCDLYKTLLNEAKDIESIEDFHSLQKTA